MYSVLKVCGMAAALSLAACGARSSLSVENEPPGGTTASSSASSSSGATGSSVATTTSSTTGGTGGCSGLPGPAMVTIPLPDGGSFCIDSTEVTNADYQAFLGANVPLSEQPGYCSWNDSYAVAFPPPPGSDLLPVVWVDWCDAYVYCAWAGKRLCGKIGGGPLEPDEIFDPMKSQWTYACTQGGLKTYPYGDTYEPTTCRTLEPENPNDGVSPVASHPGCVGGFPGIFDMSGNAVEFEDNAAGTTGENDHLVLRGGGFPSMGSDASCLAPLDTLRYGDLNGSGFRCCKD